MHSTWQSIRSRSAASDLFPGSASTRLARRSRARQHGDPSGASRHHSESRSAVGPRPPDPMLVRRAWPPVPRDPAKLRPSVAPASTRARHLGRESERAASPIIFSRRPFSPLIRGRGPRPFEILGRRTSARNARQSHRQANATFMIRVCLVLVNPLTDPRAEARARPRPLPESSPLSPGGLVASAGFPRSRECSKGRPLRSSGWLAPGRRSTRRRGDFTMRARRRITERRLRVTRWSEIRQGIRTKGGRYGHGVSFHEGA
jgi:hypothetical protein